MPAKPNLLFAIVVAISSLMIGFAISTLAYRYHYLRVPGQSIMERMNHELELTAAQRDRIGDIMRDARFKLIQARRDFQHQRHQLFWQAMTQVRGVLTPEQQKKFDRDFSRPWPEHGDDGGDYHGQHYHGKGPPDFVH